jgi:ribose 5-phosphate isomerase A
MKSNDVVQLKRMAAQQAVTHVRSGMVVGLGAGSTALLAVTALGELLSSGALHDIVAVACSGVLEAEARRLGIPLTTLDVYPELDLTIDGADEVDPALNLIKGGGGALLREKIVALASRREIIVVDISKLSPALGTRWPVPVEVIPFGWRTQFAYLESLGAQVERRRLADGDPFITDEGNFILDCNFGPIDDAALLAAQIKARPGVVEHGLFLGLATDVIVASGDGVRSLTRGALFT